MSCVPTEPYSLPSSPAFAEIVTDEPCSFARATLRFTETFLRHALEFGATRFEHRAIVLRRANGFAFRDQEIAREAALHDHFVAEVAEVDDAFQQNDVHLMLPITDARRYTAATPDTALV